MSAAPVLSRHVSAGITPDPGVYAGLTVWWSATDWSQLEVPAAVWAHRDLCRAHHVDPDTVCAVARALARFADAKTGRDCRPTNERLIDAARVSLSTIKRARRVLKALGLVVEVVAGRSNMTLAERLQAWDRRSKHRRIAATFALCSRRDRSPTPVDKRASHLRLVDGGPPPVGQVVSTQPREIRGSLRSETATKRTASRPAHTEKGSRRPSGPVDLVTRRLVRAAKERVAWLADVPGGRLTPLLTPYARADWTGRDLQLAIRNVLAARGWTVPVRFRTSPAAYLAMLLREVDPADRPGAEEEWMDELERREREWQRLRIWGPACPHGEPAGDVPSPTVGTIPCPFCRGVPADLELGEDMRPKRPTT